MPGSLFSQLWYRVADLHPQLRPDVRIQRQNYRNESWHVLTGTASGRQFRVNDKTYHFIGRCDGRRSVQEVWDILLKELGDDAPTQDEIITLLNQLESQSLLSYEIVADATAIADSAAASRKRRRRAFINPFAFRIPLGNPTAVLRRLAWLGPMLLSRTALWIWSFAVTIVSVAAFANWPELKAHGAELMASPRSLMLAWLCYPPIKLLHELGHGLAVRRWGGEVREAGFSLLVLIPAPYVDASASTAFREPRHRITVGAIGIMVELAIAAIAIAVWLNVQPGLVQDIALVVAFIASVSTLLFNGNPLLSFDGYYVLCDAIGMPSLGPRSRTYWRAILLRLVAGKSTAAVPNAAAGERKWLVSYAPLSFAYRIMISLLIVLWIASYSVFLAAAAGTFMVTTILIKPVWGMIEQVRWSVASRARRWRAAIVAGAMLTGLATLAYAVPLPHHTIAPGIVWLPEHAHVRAGTDGFIRVLTARDGERVEAGDVLVVMEDAALIADEVRLESRLEGLQSRQFSAWLTDTAEAQRVEEEILGVMNELAQIKDRIAKLTVHAQSSGTLVMPYGHDLSGTFVLKGETLGYVLDRGAIRVRAAVPEYDAALVRGSRQTAQVHIADSPASAMTAQLLRETPAATSQLPSAALGDRGGGPLRTDPADETGIQVLEPVILVDLTLPTSTLERVGSRAWVRFDHGAEPLANRWSRRLRQVFLDKVEPGGA
ncbi:MAG: efflux RND transporter periplasmic adaptor subunit [Betaproteobacteria bacterium]|nr:MAG: efflux RND transporter periplasmic adaptor subunit [Betaproteobacteria bacterium]